MSIEGYRKLVWLFPEVGFTINFQMLYYQELNVTRKLLDKGACAGPPCPWRDKGNLFGYLRKLKRTGSKKQELVK